MSRWGRHKVLENKVFAKRGPCFATLSPPRELWRTRGVVVRWRIDRYLRGVPTYDSETLAAYFQPVDPKLFDDPVAGPALRRLAREDADVIAAAADVDRSLIRMCLAKTPAERLRVNEQAARAISRFHRVG
jgi:hypothetical protein